MFYSLTSPLVAELLAVARRILTTQLANQTQLLRDLQAEAPDKGLPAPPTAPRRRSARPRPG